MICCNFLCEYKCCENCTQHNPDICGERANSAARWFKKFRFGDFSLQINGAELKTPVKNDRLKALVEMNPIVSTKKLAHNMKI